MIQVFCFGKATHHLNVYRGYPQSVNIILGLPQVPREFPKKMLKRCSNWMLRAAQKKKTENISLFSSSVWSGAKIRILRIFAQFCGVTRLRININSPEILESVESFYLELTLELECDHSSADQAARLHASCTIMCPRGGGGIWLLVHRKFINCPLKHCELWQQGKLNDNAGPISPTRNSTQNAKSCSKREKVPRNTRSCQKLPNNLRKTLYYFHQLWKQWQKNQRRTKTKTFVFIVVLNRAVLNGSRKSCFKIFLQPFVRGRINSFYHKFLILLGYRSWS